jgi:hypothetical protein
MRIFCDYDRLDWMETTGDFNMASPIAKTKYFGRS